MRRVKDIFHKFIPRCALPLILAASLTMLLSACGNTSPATKTAFCFDTVIQISIYDSSLPEDQDRDTVLSGCISLADHYEKLFSKTVKGSDIWNINNSGGAPVSVDPETADLISRFLHYCDISGRLFDPAIGSVSSLWDFSAGTEGAVPDKGSIEEALLHTDPSSISVSEEEGTWIVTLSDPETRIDLGGIAKGYVADRMKDYLQSFGVKSAIINLGGNVLVLGEKPDGTGFKVGIRKPFSVRNSPETSAVIEVRDRSVVTSGIYERYFEKDGHLYHHILDPGTGMPCDSGLYSVSILSSSSTDGDAYSTICLIMGMEKGMEFIDSIPDTEALFIADDQSLHGTSGWPGH